MLMSLNFNNGYDPYVQVLIIFEIYDDFYHLNYFVLLNISFAYLHNDYVYFVFG